MTLSNKIALILMAPLALWTLGCPPAGSASNTDAISRGDIAEVAVDVLLECEGEAPACDKSGICAEANIEATCVATTEGGNQWQCDYSGVEGYVENDEVCDGKDSDCDGKPDEEEKEAIDICEEGTFTIREGDEVLAGKAGVPGQGVCKGEVKVKCGVGNKHECDYDGIPDFTEFETINVGGETVEGMDEPLELGHWCDNLDNDCDGQTDSDTYHFDMTAGKYSLEQFDEMFEFGDCPTVDGVMVGVCEAILEGKGDTHPWDVSAWQKMPIFVTRCTASGNFKCGLRCKEDAEDCDYDEYLLSTGYEKVETTCDGLDNDCDGETDEVFDAESSTCPHLGVCTGKVEAICKNLESDPEEDPNIGWACIFDNDLMLDPSFQFQDLPACQGEAGCGAELLCDGLDNDCDGLVDEGLQWPQKCFHQDLEGTVSYRCDEDEDCSNYHPGCELAQPVEFVDCPFTEKIDVKGQDVVVPLLDTEGIPLFKGVCMKDPATGESQVRLSCADVDTDDDAVPDAGYWTCNFDVVDDYYVAEHDPIAKISACDGLDNNCDGVVDGKLETNGSPKYNLLLTSDSDPGMAAQAPCRNVGACAGHWIARCNVDGNSPGKWSCEYDGDDIEQNLECDGGFANCIWTETSCDNKDNDCDGEIDEALDGLKMELDLACVGKMDVGVCLATHLDTYCPKGDIPGKKFQCDYSGVPSFIDVEEFAPEYCDALDNDCDGEVDEQIFVFDPAGHQSFDTGCYYQGVCSKNTKATCVPLEEPVLGEANWECDYSNVEYFDGYVATQGAAMAEVQCDGLDNDCDGLVDEDLDADLGWADDLNPKLLSGCPLDGICIGKMAWSCNSDGGAHWECDPSEVGPLYQVEELSCDGHDNDCDNDIDEDLTDPGPTPGAGCKFKGVCSENVKANCIQGNYICNYDLIGPDYDDNLEIQCDGLDNDCDGVVDEDLKWADDNGCLTVGVCDDVNLTADCLGDEGWDCHYVLLTDYQADSEHSCDGLDNDCDGLIDEVTCEVCDPCIDDTSCKTGSCVAVPSASGTDEKYCAVNNTWCVFVDPTSGQCAGVQQDNRACATLTQPCLCGFGGLWYCEQQIQPCTGTTPVCYDGFCKTCVPYSMKCDGNNKLECSADGEGWSPEGICGLGTICVGEGKCVPNTEIKVSTHNLSSFNADINPRVAPRAGGGFAVVFWSQNTGSMGGNNKDVLFRLYDGELDAESPVETMVNTLVSGAQENPAISAFPRDEGGFVVVWEDTNGPQPDHEDVDIVGQIFDNDGNKVGSALPINTSGVGNQENPAVAGLENGSFVVVWEHELLGESEYPEIMGQLFKWNGEPADDGPFQVNEWIAGGQTLPAIADRGKDGFSAAWTSIGQVDNYDVFFKHYTKGATAVTTEAMTNVYSTGAQRQSAIAGFNGMLEGSVVQAWESINQDGSSTGVFMRIFDEDGMGSPAVTDIPVNKKVKAGAQRDPAVAVLEDNTVVVVWETVNFLEGDTTFEEVVAKALDEEGNEYYEDEFLVNETTFGKQYNPDVASLPGRSFVVVWTNSPSTSEYDIYARLFVVED